MKTLSSYSHLIEQQRKIIFKRRNDLLFGDSILDFYEAQSPDYFAQLTSKIDGMKIEEVCRFISLVHLDKCWSQYLAEIAEIREGIHLARLGGEIPTA